MKAGILLLLGALGAGAMTRLLAGTALVQTELATAPLAVHAVPTGGPESAVQSFYQSLSDGSYDKAWEVSVEPVWAGAAGASYTQEVRAGGAPVGWSAEQVFVSRCRADAGERIRVGGLEVTRLPTAPDSPETRAAAALHPSALFGVRASGKLLGACLVYRWERDLAVAELDGRYKVVLPGTRPAKALPHESWFSNLSLVASLRNAGK